VAVIAGAATVTASILLFHTHASVKAAIGAFAWAAAATALTAVIPTIEAAAPTCMPIYFPVIIISGVFGAISEPSWLAAIAGYLPAQPLIHGLTTALGDSTLPTARDIVLLAAWAVAGLAVAVATFRWEPHRPTQKRAART
jgi:hypothetical protein